MRIQNAGSKSAREEEKPIRFNNLFWNYFQFWPIILLCALLGGVLANTYLKYTSPVYSARSKILIKDENNSGQLSEAAVFEDLGLITRSGNIENEMEILQSVHLMKQVVANLGIKDIYIVKGTIRDVDIYRDNPFELKSWIPADTSAGEGLDVEVEVADSMRYTVFIGGGSHDGVFGKPLQTAAGTLTAQWRSGFKPHAQRSRYRVVLRSLDDAAAAFAGGLSIKSVGKRSTVLELTQVDQVLSRARDVLDELSRLYGHSQLEDKNRIYENTIRFIDERLQLLTGELSGVETQVERFKTVNRVVDLPTEGTLLMEQTGQYGKTLSDTEIQMEILKGIRDFLRRQSDRFDFIPSNMGINNLTLTGMLENFNQIMLEREKALNLVGPGNPQVVAYDRQLTTLRGNIMRNIDALQKDLIITRNALQNKERQIQGRIRNIPRQERQLVEIQRLQSVKQNLFLYLLQKREESELSKAVSVANNRIVEPARPAGQVAPVRRNVYALGVGGGLVFPLLVISLLQALNTKVRNVDDIRRHTRVPMLGLINYAAESYPVAVTRKSRTVISEMFRLIRANLQFVGNGEHNRVIVVTSSVSGEGKTFVSLNIAITLALAGKRVLLLELDMRSPKLEKHIGSHLDDKVGITQYLVNPGMSWHEVVQHRPDLAEGLHLVVCGTVPPNPGELIMGKRMEELFEAVRDEFDYVVVDTAPVGLVSDTLHLNRYADTTIYVVRKDVTSLSHLEIVEEIATEGRMPRPYIVMNAVRKRILGYGQGALYGYGNYGGGRNVVESFRKWVGQRPSGNGRTSTSRRKGIPQKHA
jgi:capsular exopolysaccharide synthesis family protein